MYYMIIHVCKCTSFLRLSAVCCKGLLWSGSELCLGLCVWGFTAAVLVAEAMVSLNLAILDERDLRVCEGKRHTK